MPDISNRDRKEAALAALLRRAFGKTKDRIIDALGMPPDVDNVPDALWDELTADVEADLQRALAVALLRGVRGMNSEYGDQFGFVMAPQDAARQAEQFSTRRARNTARQMVDTFRDRVAYKAGQAKEKIDRRVAEARRGEIELPAGRPFEDVARELGVDIKEAIETQADAAGATETTTAHTAGERTYRDGLEKEKEILVVARWNIDPRSNVCPICYALNGAWEETWGEEYRDGPPAHPSCACFLTWEPIQ